jgi:predicted permease
MLAKALESDPAGPAILGDLQEDFARESRARGPAAARRWYWREATLLMLGRMLPRTRSDRAANRGASPPAEGVRELVQDAHYALRVIRRTPGYSLFTAAMIALGVGAATSVFSLLRPLVLAPLPFPEPNTLVWIQNRSEPGDNSLSAVTSRTANLKDFRERARSFEGLTGYNAFFDQVAYTLTGAGEPERVVGATVAYDFLDVLGVEPALGRGFTEGEGEKGGPRAVMLSHGFWLRRFAGDPRVVGGVVTLNGDPYAVVGVLPRWFDFSSLFTPGVPVDFLLPMPIAGVEEVSDFQGNVLFMVGRLRTGVTPESAQAELDRLVTAMEQEQPERWGLGAVLTPLHEHLAGPFRPALLLLAAAAGTLLLIVCVNVSNLALSRSPGRAREVAVRKAFGAPRKRLVRQLLLETLGISVVGALLASALAWAATSLVGRAAGVRIPLLAGVQMDGSALLFAAAVAVLAGLAVGILPALQVAEGGESAALRSARPGSSAGPGGRRLRELLVFAEVALTCVLLVAGGLLVRSFRSVLAVDLGFEPAQAVAWQLTDAGRFQSISERADFYGALAQRVRSIPGVEQAGLVDGLPLGRNRTWGFSVEGEGEEQEPARQLVPHIVDPGYLAAMRIGLVAGRNISPLDDEDAPRVVLMNESSARRVFGGEDPLGRRIRIWGPGSWEVVGIVEDVRDISPEMEPGVQVYFPLAQMPDYQSLDLVVRSARPTEGVVATVSAALRALDPTMPTGEYWTLESTVARVLSARRFTLGVLGAFGAAAVVLAGLGIYGVLAQAVAERRTEIGIRMALGATAQGVVATVVRQTLFLVLAGIVAGAVLSLVSAGLLESLLFGVGASDPAAFLGMTGVLLLVAVLASAVPAARAARTPGAGALRGD